MRSRLRLKDANRPHSNGIQLCLLGSSLAHGHLPYLFLGSLMDCSFMDFGCTSLSMFHTARQCFIGVVAITDVDYETNVVRLGVSAIVLGSDNVP